MVLTGSSFGGDWPGHLWLVQMQARNISYLGHPSLFAQSSLGAFEPWFAFYGGTLYSIVAAGAVLSGGHTLAAYILSFALAMAMAYGGFTWLAKQAGLRGWAAHLSGFVFLTSAYYISDAYGRGAWPETVATSSLPLVVAAGISLLRAERWRPLPVAGLVVGTVVFTGSHNITLLYGTLFLVLCGAAILAAFGRTVLPSRKRAAGVVGLGLLAASINLWFLLPDIAYQGRVTIAHSFTSVPSTDGISPGLLFSPYRHSRIPGFLLDMQIPSLALVWALAVLVSCRGALDARWRRLAVAMTIVGAPFLALVLIPGLWHAVPKLFWAIQFNYRLLTYVDYCVAVLVMIAAMALLRTRRGQARTVLLAVGVLFAAVEVRQAINQEWSTPSSLKSRSEAFPGASKAPSYWQSFASYLEFQDVSLPVTSATISELPGVTVYDGQGANVVPIPVTERPRSGYAVSLMLPKSGTVNTNVIAGPYLVAVHGARFVGRTPASELVMQVDKPPSGPARVTFSAARTWPIVLGKWATLVSLLGVISLLVALTIRRLGERRRAGSSRASPRPPPAS